MQFLNATKMLAGYTLGMQPDGRELLVVVIKGTFAIPQQGEAPRLLAEQAPLVMADVATGAPGVSAPLYESDYAPRKPFCDVLLHGSAYAPGGYPAERVQVGLRVGALVKTFDVVGQRVWQGGLPSVRATAPQPFTTLPISYNNAFGGTDNSHPDPQKHRTYLANHAGVGYHEQTAAKLIDGKPLPNTEERGTPVKHPQGNYRPMAFGPVGRAWQPRAALAGTYDSLWLERVFPFLPADFDERYYQAAAPDQWLPYPRGGEPVELLNLTPRGQTVFHLPQLNIPVVFSLKRAKRKETTATLDTIIIEPDRGRFMLCWRATLALRRSIFEVAQVVAGRMPPRWYRARQSGKTYYPSLREAVRRNPPALAQQETAEAAEAEEAASST